MRNARNTRLARTRKRAQPLVAHQCTLSRTACDRSETRRVGRARRGGAGRPCSADACEEGPSPRACKSSTSCTSALGCAATHGGGTSPAGPTGDRHDAHVVSREHVPHRDGGLRVARRSRALGRHDRDHRRQKAARGSALLVPGDKKRALKPPLVPALPERGRAHAQWRSAATRSHQAPPARASSIETRRCWLGTTPLEGRLERPTTATGSVQRLPRPAQNGYRDSAYLAVRPVTARAPQAPNTAVGDSVAASKMPKSRSSRPGTNLRRPVPS